MTPLLRLIGFLLPIYVGLAEAQCPENEVGSISHECGTECIPTCQGTPEICHCRPPPIFVTFIFPLCHNCLCKEGYIRDQPQGKCVPKEECHRVVQCPENEEFSERKPYCARSCQNRKNQSLEYSFGCVCKKGYIREGTGGRCVRESCKDVIICKKNETWVPCVHSPIYCNATENYICDLPRICRPGCYCAHGYIRRSPSDPTCISTSECPCNENEVYLECGTTCPEICPQQNRTSTTCPLECVRGCFCKKGYVLDNSKEKCIEKSECLRK